MVKSSLEGQAKIYLCEVCGYGYRERDTAEACEQYCSTHNACSFEITSKAIKRPSR